MMNTVAASHRINKGMGEGIKLLQLFIPWSFRNYPGYPASCVCGLVDSDSGVSGVERYLEFFLKRFDLIDFSYLSLGFDFLYFFFI